MSHSVFACERGWPIAGSLPVCGKCGKFIEYADDMVLDSSLLHYFVGTRYHFYCALERKRDIVTCAREFCVLALKRAKQDPKKCARLEIWLAKLDEEHGS